MKWIPEGIEIKIDSPELPTASLVSVDLEYSEDGNELVLIGIFDGTIYWGYLHVSSQLVSYLQKVNWICTDGIHAELQVLNKLYGGFSAKQIQYDVKLMGYVYDSAAKDWGLKSLAKRYLGVERPTYSQLKKEYKFKSIKELPQEVLIDYNGADCIDAFNLLQYFRKHFNQRHWDFYNNIELPTNHLLAKMEAKGIKINTKEVRRIHNENSKKRRQEKKNLLLIAGREFNPNSPRQVLPILIDKGVRAKNTSEDEIKKYKDNEFVKSLLTYRGLNKICSTYTIPLYTNAIQAVDNRIHARFSQNTITGRLSSSDPINLQNQPPAVRGAFVAGDGKLFVGCDWTNVEIFLPANFSGEQNLLNELAKPEGDIHEQTSRLIFGHVTEESRRRAKTCNFLLTNSGSSKRLRTELNCTQQEADEIFKKFWEGYPTLAAWIKETKRKAREQKGVGTLYGRWVTLDKISSWCGRSNCPVFGTNGFWCKECFIREETEREAVSIKVQGSASDIMKLAAIRLYREYGYVPNALIHDEYLAEFQEAEAQLAAERIKHVMENICDLQVPLKAKAKIGRSWKDVH